MANLKYKWSDGSVLPRCTTVINVLGFNKDALVAWAKREGKRADEISTTAKNTGTLVHKAIEFHLANRDRDPFRELEEIQKASFDELVVAQSSYNKWLDWERENEIDIVASEYPIFSSWCNFGGTADLIFTRKDANGRTLVCLGDFKTSKGVYEDHVVQVSAYRRGIEVMNNYSDDLIKELATVNKREMFRLKDVLPPKHCVFDEVVLFHIPKEEGDVKQYTLNNTMLDDGEEAFECARTLYNLKTKLRIKNEKEAIEKTIE